MESKQELLDQAYRLAFKYEAELGSCPQCVLAIINPNSLLHILLNNNYLIRRKL